MTHEQHSFSMHGEGFGRGASMPEGHNERMFEGGYGGTGADFSFSVGGGGQGQYNEQFLDCNEDMGAGFGERGSRGRMRFAGRGREHEMREMQHLRHKMMRLKEEIALDGGANGMPAAYSNFNGNPETFTDNSSAYPQTMPADYVPPTGPQVAPTGDNQAYVPSQVDPSQEVAAQNYANQSPSQTNDGSTVAQPQIDASAQTNSDASAVDPNQVLDQIIQNAQSSMTPEGFQAFMQALQTEVQSGQQTDLGGLLQATMNDISGPNSHMQQADMDALNGAITNAAQAASQGATPTYAANTDNSADAGPSTTDPALNADLTPFTPSAAQNNTVADNGTGATGQDNPSLASNPTGQDNSSDSGPTVDATVAGIVNDLSTSGSANAMSSDGLDKFVAQLGNDLTTGGAQSLDDGALMQRVYGELKANGMSADDLSKLAAASNQELTAAQTPQTNNGSSTANG